jgi:hypothetical protein
MRCWAHQGDAVRFLLTVTDFGEAESCSHKIKRVQTEEFVFLEDLNRQLIDSVS